MTIPPAAQHQQIRVYYYDEPPLDLLLDAVAPTLRALQTTIPGAFFGLHWLCGPHVRVQFPVDAATLDATVRPVIEAMIGGFLAARPSTRTLDSAGLRPIYAHLAHEEQIAEPILPLRPNNSLHYLPADRRLELFGDEGVAAVVEGLLAATNELAFSQLAAIRAGASRLSLAFDLMVATAHAATGAITNGFLSYRSHAEAFIEGWPAPAETRAAFARHYQAHGPALARRMRLILDALNDRSELPMVTAWATALSHCRAQAIATLRARGPASFPRGRSNLGAEEVQAIQARLRRSSFHSVLQADAARRTALWQNLGFQTYRLLLNAQYLHLSRLGVRPYERFLLCHLVAETVEATFEVSAAQLLAIQLADLRLAQSSQGAGA